MARSQTHVTRPEAEERAGAQPAGRLHPGKTAVVLVRPGPSRRLTWSDVGEVLGKSEDMAAKYASGEATMDVIAYTRARVEWNGRFTGSIDKLVQSAGGEIDAHHVLTLIFSAGGEIARALEDGSLTDEEIRKARKHLEDLRAGIDRLLHRVGPKAVTA